MAGPDGKDNVGTEIGAGSNPRVLIPDGGAALDDSVAAARSLQRAFAGLLETDPGKNGLVLCDDQPQNRIMFRRTLSRRGGLPEQVQVTEFGDGKELIAYLGDETRRSAIATIVCDYEMPFKNGADVAEFLRREVGDRVITFVMATGKVAEIKRSGKTVMTVDDRVDALIESGEIDKLLVKPDGILDLQRVVAAAMQRRAILRGLTGGASGAFAVEELILAAARGQQAVGAPAGSGKPAVSDGGSIGGIDPFGHRRITK